MIGRGPIMIISFICVLSMIMEMSWGREVIRSSNRVSALQEVGDIRT
jgi:hypothetical protein